MSLLAYVRSLTSVPSTLVPDTVVEAAITRHRVWNDELVCWHTTSTGAARVWGMLDSAEAAVFDADDVEVDRTTAGATLDQRGGITLAAAGTEPAWRVVGYGVDVNAVAADVCAAASVACATAFDFSTDGQSFSRSQQAAAYRASADDFAAGMLPRHARMGRRDDAGAGVLTRVAGRRVR